jgi:alpha-tubulin suppressor-like RCC1 family protein
VTAGRVAWALMLVGCAPREADAPTVPAAVATRDVDAVSGRVAAGLVHSCVVVDGTVQCWGYNGHGELGDGTRADRRTPGPVAGVTDAVAVVTGDGHACALRRGGTVVCWGDGESGQLGDGTGTSRLTPVAVAGLAGASQLAAGAGHTCAIGQGGAVWCWGSDLFGESDAVVDPEHRQLRPVRVGELRGATSIAASRNYACATVGGEVHCWGQMPMPDPPGGSAQERTLRTVPGVTDAVEVAAGDRHACARTGDGRALCWGDGREGQRGDGARDELPPRWHGPHPPPWRPPPRGVVEVVGVAGATRVSASSDSTCVIGAGGGVQCWGAGRDGQLGDGGSEAQSRAVAARIDGVIDLSVGSAHACARRSDGRVWCWGYDEFGQASGGASQASGPLWPIEGQASAVAIGAAHICGLDGGAVWCAGENGYGQLGDGTFTGRTAAAKVPGIADAVQVLAGARHTCARLRDGTVRCWGDDTFGQMGQRGAPPGEPMDEHGGRPEPTAPRRSPVPVAPVGLGEVKLLAGHEHWTCGLQTDGAVACWHDSGETPVSVTQRLPASAQALAIGVVHNCAVLAGGEVKCWGLNFYGRIGDGTRIDRPQATAVVGLGGPAVAVAAGRLHTCALLQAGTVACWGTGFAGRLGDGTEEERATPVRVVGLPDAVAIAAGYEYSCALRRGGEVVCWGSNTDGVLGDGTHGSRLVPVQVAGLAPAAAIAAGEHHTCAVLRDGGVRCWGEALRAGPETTARSWQVARVPVGVPGL